MKGTILALFVAAVAAQSSAGSSTTTALTPEQSCLNSCAPSDVNCQAICVGVPHPGDAQMGLVTDCVGKCDQGDGSAAASEAYSKCRDACLASYIITSGTAAPGGAYTTAAIPGVSTTAAANSASVSAAGAGSSAASAASASGSAASKSGSAAASSSTAKSSSAAAGKVTAQIGGVAGLMLGALAML